MIGVLLVAAGVLLSSGSLGSAQGQACGFPDVSGLHLARQDTAAVALMIPDGARRQEYDSTDSEYVTWSYGKATVRLDYGVGVGPLRTMRGEARVCRANIGGFPAVVETWRTRGGSVVNAYWEHVGHGENSLSLTIEGSLDSERDSLAVVSTVRFINDPSKIRLVGVRPGVRGPTAVILDETGLRKSVEVGEVFTRDRGWLSEIRDDGAVLTEWRHEGDRGWFKMDRDLILENE